MAEKPRIKLPSSAKKGEVIEIKTLIAHPMETGLRLAGTVELAGLLGQELGAHGGFWGWAAGIDLNTLGFVIAGLFVLTWAIALSIWHFGRIEERWTAREPDAGPVVP